MNNFLCFKTTTYCLLVSFFFFLPQASAWDCHFLITYNALKNTVSNTPSVSAETLEDFLTKEQMGLRNTLAKQEDWAQHHIESYRTLPSYLNWDVQNKTIPIQLRFVHALRINPFMKFPLFIQNPPGQKPRFTNKAFNLDEIVAPELLSSSSLHVPSPPLMGVSSNDLLSPLEILASASDEPDYGMDINLWADSPSWFGAIYGWGVQPFGNKTLTFTSQIPFHMGFYYESKLMYAAAPYLKQTYPEYRIHQYLNLSRYAFSTGHNYWGYRFLGWALHYAQDLTQPYHSTLSPNVSTAKLLYVETLRLIGIQSPEQNAIQLLTNRHNSLENYEYYYIKDRIKNKDTHFLSSDSALDKSYPDYSDTYLREVIAKESNLLAASIDKILVDVFPRRYVSDASYIFYQTESSVNLFDLVKNREGLDALNTKLDELLGHAEAHTRKIVQSVKHPP